MKKHILLSFATMLSLTTTAQVSRLADEVEYKAEINAQFSNGDNAPFWFSANRYGLATINDKGGYLRAAVKRNTEADSTRNWRIGYGADIAVPINYNSNFIVQQLYGELQYKAIRLSVGQKERPLELKNQQLTSGGMTMGVNARPIPQVRIELPDFLVFKKTKNWIAVKGHLAYGAYTDNKWQRDFNSGNKKAVYTANSLYHSKAGFLRIGNTEQFPLTLTGGIEMVCQFGGTVWNRGIKEQNADGSYKLPSGIKQYLEAFFPSGGDITDNLNSNATGNQVGSWLARLDYTGKTWKASFYAEHFFEDHSQLGWDFAWKDMLYGAEVTLPRNPFVTTLLYEHMRTTDQSGPAFVSMSNHVSAIGGVDDYYNHGLYGAYQHAGFNIGSPVIVSPIYNTNGSIYCYDNRIIAHHIGISGNPTRDLSYRILFTHEKSYGTYDKPREEPIKGHFLLAEATYSPASIEGLSFTASYGQNGGELLGDSKGGMFTISYSGKVNKKRIH